MLVGDNILFSCKAKGFEIQFCVGLVMRFLVLAGVIRVSLDHWYFILGFGLKKVVFVLFCHSFSQGS